MLEFRNVVETHLGRAPKTVWFICHRAGRIDFTSIARYSSKFTDAGTTTFVDPGLFLLTQTPFLGGLYSAP